MSFASGPPWQLPKIKAWVCWLDERSQGTKESDIELDNLSNTETYKSHAEFFAGLQRVQREAKDFWSKRTEIYPYLTLLQDQIGNELKTWSHRQNILEKALEALAVLNQFSEAWHQGHYRDYQHRYLQDMGLQAQVSGESPSVRKNPKTEKARTFWLDDGRKLFFENHIKLPDGFRLHFYPDSQKKHIYIGYLGPHLPLS